MARLVVKNVPYDPIKDFVPMRPRREAPLMFIVNPAKVRARISRADGRVKPIKTVQLRHFRGWVPRRILRRKHSPSHQRRYLIVLTRDRSRGQRCRGGAGQHDDRLTVAPFSWCERGKLRALR